jgi:hypothetical protein
MGVNLLKTPGFETTQWNKVDRWGSMTVPDGWNAFFIDNPGKKKVPWDPANETGIVAPEFKPVDKEPPYLDPPRGRWSEGGNWSACWFAFWKVMDAGLYQQVNVTPGQSYRLAAWAHGWSNSGSGAVSGKHANDPKWSDGAGVGYNAFFQLADPAWPDRGNSPLDDAVRNMVFQVGLDPTGGTDAFASTVVWGAGAHIYNVFHETPPVEVVAQSSRVTVFLRCKNLWGFMHNDAYWDDSVLEAVGVDVVEVPGTLPPGITPHPVPPPVTPPVSPPPPPSTGASKLGAHILVMNADTAAFIASGPAVVKFVGDWGSSAGVPAGTFIIGRQVFDGDAQEMRSQGMTPEKAAHKFINAQRGTYQANPPIKYWEGHNEPVWGDLDGMKWYADFEIARMQEMAQLGLKCVIGNFATGTPPIELWPGFMGALQAARQFGAVLGLHEYSCPWIWWMTGRYQMEPSNCVDPNNPNRIEGWTTLRYRQVYRQYLQPNGLGDVPLVITEFGIDPLVNPKPNDAPDAAWRDLSSYWNKHKGDAAFDYANGKYPPPADISQPASPGQFYFEQLKWYDRQMQQDPYVIGATIFTFGSFGGAWSRFDVTGDNSIAGTLTEYVTQQKSVSAPPTQAAPSALNVQPAVTPYGGLKVRTARNIDASYVEALPAGVSVAVLEGPVIDDNGYPWVRVRAPSGREGWSRISGDGGEAYLAPPR